MKISPPPKGGVGTHDVSYVFFRIQVYNSYDLSTKTLATTETSIVNWSSRSQPSTCHRQTSLARKRSHLTHLARITDQLNQLSTHLLWWQLSFHITVIDTHLLDERSHTLRALLLMITKIVLAIIVLTKTSIRQRKCSEAETWKYSITLQRPSLANHAS